jgi:hypothetical protein
VARAYWETRELRSNTRAAVAVIAAAAVNRRSYCYVRERSARLTRSVTVSVKDGQIDAFDHAASCRIDGRISGDLYHHGDESFIEMAVSGVFVDGFDYATRSFYEGKIIGTTVQVYDYDTASFYLYDVD